MGEILPSKQLRRGALWGLALVLALVAAVLFAKDRSYSGDEDEILFQTRALFEHRSLYLDPYVRELPIERQLVGENGHYYSKYGIGYPLLIATLQTLLSWFGADHALVGIHLAKVPSAFLFFCSGLVIFLLLVTAGANPRLAGLTALAYLTTTYATFYAAIWPANIFEASLLVFSVYFFYLSHVSQKRWRSWLIISGSFLGYAGLCRIFPFSLYPFFLLVLLIESWRRVRARQKGWVIFQRALCFSVPVVVALLVHLYVNYLRLGHLGSSYGSEWFTTPFLIGFLGSLFWPAKSFFLLAPLTLISIWGFPALFKKDRLLFVLAAGISVFYIVTMSKWCAWRSGPDLGQRFWLPAVPFLLLPLGFLKKRSLLISAFLLGAAGLWIQVRMYHCSPGVVYERIYRDFPFSEEDAVVAEVLKTDFAQIVRKTYLELKLLRSM